jgi:hypothetical protein
VALFIRVGRLLKGNKEEIQKYFSDDTSDTKFMTGVNKNNKEILLSRKTIKDTCRKEFRKIFCGQWLKQQFHLYRNKLVPNSEAEAIFVEEVEPKAVLPKISKVKIDLGIDTKTKVNNKFIELYITCIHKHQDKYFNMLQEDVNGNIGLINKINNILNDIQVPENSKLELSTVLDALKKQSIALKKHVNAVLTETAVGKIGVTTENSAHWGSRMNTFSVCRNSKKFECLHISPVSENCKIIEALAFARLQAIGLKVRMEGFACSCAYFYNTILGNEQQNKIITRRIFQVIH